MRTKKYFSKQEARDGRNAILRAAYAANPQKYRDNLNERRAKKRAELVAAGKIFRVKYSTAEERKAARKKTIARYYQKHRRKILSATKEYGAKNPERARVNLRNWRIRNKQRYRDNERRWIKENRDRVKATRKRSYLKHAEKYRANHRKWTKANRHRAYLHVSLRRESIRLHPESNKTAMLAIYSSAVSLTRSTGIPHSVDHLIPVRHGGWHHQDNLQVLESKMNHGKHANPFWLAPHMGIKDWRDVPRHLWPEALTPEYSRLIEQNKGVSIRWDTAA